MNFPMITSIAAVLILVVATPTMSQAAPSCTGCGKGHVCIIEAANATHPAQPHCFKICPIAVICPFCAHGYTCKAVGGTCAQTRAICVPNQALAH